MRTPSRAEWSLIALAALMVFAVWSLSGGGGPAPPGGIEAELAWDEMEAASLVRRSKALVGELDAHLRGIEEENARLRARLARDAEESRAVMDRQAAAIDALTRLLEAPADLPVEDVRPGAGAGGRKERARGGPPAGGEVPGL